MSKVIVLGSINMDLVISTDRLPKVGETIMGNRMDYMIGGKGANQAVAASRIGAETMMLGKVGKDTFGEKLLSHISREKVNMDAVKMEKNIFSGIAGIFKLAEDNSIVVVSGANQLVDGAYLKKNEAVFQEGDILLCQLEIPIDTVLKAFQLAKQKGVRTILNPAPYNDRVVELLPYTDIITPNETEFEALIDREKQMNSDEDFEKAMLDFSLKYGVDVVVTRGADGVSFSIDGQVLHQKSIKIKVMDTTGAGDTLNGILAGCLTTQKFSYKDAVIYSSIGASLSVQALGAQNGMPTQEEVTARVKKENACSNE